MAFIPDESIERMTELTPGALRLFLFLCRCRNSKTGRCFPSVRLCAESIDSHPKNIFKMRKELAGKGFASFEGDNATLLHFFKSSENATTCDESKEDAPEVAKTLPPDDDAAGESSDFATLSNENATIGEENKDTCGEVAKTLPDSSENATLGEGAGGESRKRYPMVAKTLPDGSENATAYKEEPLKEPLKEIIPAAESAYASESRPKLKPAAADLASATPFQSETGADPAFDAINAMSSAVFAAYRTGGGTITKQFEARVAEQVVQLLAMDATLDTLAAFFRQRRKLPGLNYLANDWQTWAVNLNHAANGGTNGANAIHRGGAQGHSAKSFEQAAERIKARKVF